MSALRALRRAAALAAVALSLGCASGPPLSTQARTDLEALHESVVRVERQIVRTSDALDEVRQTWDGDAKRAVSAYYRESGALETRVKELAAPDDSRPLARWDNQLEAIKDDELASAPEADHAAVDFAIGRLQAQLAELQDDFAPVYERAAGFTAAFRLRVTDQPVDDQRHDIGVAIGQIRDIARRLRQFAASVEDLASG